IEKNLIPAGSFPYRAPAGALIDSGNYQKALELVKQDGRIDDLRARREEARREGRLYGIGFAAIVEPAQSNMGYLSTINTAEFREKAGPKGGNVATATVNVDPLGAVSVTADSLPQGQGHMTVLAQITADQLGLSPLDITVNMERDTHKDSWSIATGNYSSRFSSATAVAGLQAAQQVRDKLAKIAAKLLNVSVEKVEFGNGNVYAVDDVDNVIRFSRVAGTAHWSPSELPADVSPGISETASLSAPQIDPPNEKDQINTSLTYGFLFDVCGVEVDVDTGEVRIDKYITMHDAGRLLNPLLADGQVYGSFAWGLGAALHEEFRYGEDGSFLSGTFAEYLCPTACEVPEPEILHMESPSPFTPLGAKGIGEGNCMSTPVCIANAVCDATGISNLRLPLTPSKIAGLLRGEEPSRPDGIESSQALSDSGATLDKGEAGLRGSGETVLDA
ncbi:MAG: molybdopterin cofactor-binding domain-containing protein, partial [Haliea sp.]